MVVEKNPIRIDEVELKILDGVFWITFDEDKFIFLRAGKLTVANTERKSIGGDQVASSRLSVLKFFVKAELSL